MKLVKHCKILLLANNLNFFRCSVDNECKLIQETLMSLVACARFLNSPVLCNLEECCAIISSPCCNTLVNKFENNRKKLRFEFIELTYARKQL